MSCARWLKRVGSKPTLRKQQVAPLLGCELARDPAPRTSRTSRFESLDRPEGLDAERPSALLQRGAILQLDLGVEAAGEHPLVLADERVVDVDVLELQARQLDHVGVRCCVEPRRDDVDDLDRALSRAPAT